MKMPMVDVLFIKGTDDSLLSYFFVLKMGGFQSPHSTLS